MVQNIGNIDQEKIVEVRNLMSQIPGDIKDLSKNSFSARALIYCLLIDSKNIEVRGGQLQILQENADEKVFELVKQNFNKVLEVKRKHRLALIELSISSLKQLSKNQFKIFKDNINRLIKADSKIDLFEWCLKSIVLNGLDREFNENYIDTKPKYNLQNIKNEAGLFLSLASHIGGKSVNAKNIFNETVAYCKLHQLTFFEKDEIKISKLDYSISKLRQLIPSEKKKFLEACAFCISKDEITSSKLEILRAFSAILDCPMSLI